MLRVVGRWRVPVVRCLGLVVLALVCGAVGAACSGDPPPRPPVALCGIRSEACRAPQDCCSGLCVFSECGCVPKGAPCGSDSECCDGSACVGGVCAAGCRADGSRCAENSECCSGGCEGTPGNCGPARCNDKDEPCTTSADCCNELACRNGACASGCGIDGAACSVAGDCCGGYECGLGLKCQHVCAHANEACDDKNRVCCDGERCTGGICQACSDEGYTCSSDTDCCAKLTCSQGACTCKAEGVACGADSECCPGSLCFNGVCACSSIGNRCMGATDCCAGPLMDLACNAAGECRPASCHANTWVCADASDCCQKGCENGSCCGALGTDCESTPDNCCSGLTCWSDTHTCRACATAGHGCTIDRECCDGGTCIQGACHAKVGGACVTNDQCVPYTQCENGSCCGVAGLSCGATDCCRNFVCENAACRGLPGAPCTDDYECHSDRSGGSADCRGGKCCYRAGAACGTPSECCTGGCVAGKCTCGGIGTACDFTIDCCSGNCDFSTHLCVCGTSGMTCSAAGDCCTGYDCGASGTCCGASGQRCTTGATCCSGTCRGNGSCG